ncbi:SDH family Clp fold serine proteinase [Pseudomonas sp. B21-021]|uniref:SDH family Clp fold serine proteinase n=1 Tax=Pseudomonas sp. B21-021 TaxID=2895476 RepID=UPI002160E90F|nr:hypothetical protein [Pseudomonas sp. B21-021]UVM28779.1 hypothetical protein LOY31_06800 [Pseudomonas sp. B21-021]
MFSSLTKAQLKNKDVVIVPESFPRSKDLPPQSPLFWVTHKDRYLRQLLLKDIQEETGRALIVYFTECETSGAQIDTGDDVFFSELLTACAGQPVDLLLETNGGMTDAAEKICALLRHAAPDLRVIVPRRAKSNGTVFALCGSAILMGVESELGPIDPSINGVPVEFVLNQPTAFGPLDVAFAAAARNQTRKLARDMLSTGMMSERTPAEIEETIGKLATRDHYHSHGSVIDIREAVSLGLNVIEHQPDNDLWRKIWLLRTMFHYDCRQNGYAKLFESVSVSTAVAVQKSANA